MPLCNNGSPDDWYDEETVEYAIVWATSPQTKLTKGLAPAIKWACTVGPEMPKSPELMNQENKDYAQKFDGVKNKVCEVYALTKYVEIVMKGGQCQSICIDYKDKEFRKKLNEALKKCKIL